MQGKPMTCSKANLIRNKRIKSLSATFENRRRPRQPPAGWQGAVVLGT